MHRDRQRHLIRARTLVLALLASAAVPGLFGPVVIEGRHYIDGGHLDGGHLAAGGHKIDPADVARLDDDAGTDSGSA